MINQSILQAFVIAAELCCPSEHRRELLLGCTEESRSCGGGLGQLGGKPGGFRLFCGEERGEEIAQAGGSERGWSRGGEELLRACLGGGKRGRREQLAELGD
jgi:hypothetical protein